MLSRTIVAAIVAWSATLAPAMSFAASPASPVASSSGCAFRDHRVVSVGPYVLEQTPIKTTFKRLGGARLFVAAEPGLTVEYLRSEVASHITAMGSNASMEGCPLAAGDVRVQVNSAGTGFWVDIVAKDPSKAEEVLRRARLLIG
jgi:hypothetical protein